MRRKCCVIAHPVSHMPKIIKLRDAYTKLRKKETSCRTQLYYGMSPLDFTSTGQVRVTKEARSTVSGTDHVTSTMIVSMTTDVTFRNPRLSPPFSQEPFFFLFSAQIVRRPCVSLGSPRPSRAPIMMCIIGQRIRAGREAPSDWRSDPLQRSARRPPQHRPHEHWTLRAPS